METLALMEVTGNGSNKGEDGQQEGKEDAMKQNVTMGMEVLDCPVCSNPLRPPIFQCSMGHFVCLPCRDKLPDQVCSGVVLQSSCYGMERVVESILVPCPYAEHGCTKSIIYYLKEEHKEVCPHEPCFCPNPGCGFAGPTVALLDHFTAEHKWPKTAFKYNYPFVLVAKPGVHVLCGQDRNIFLLNVTLPMSPLHAVSLVCIQPNSSSELSSFRCYVDFSCWKQHHQHSSLEAIRNSSLSDGLPKDCFCFVPKASVRLSITIDDE